MKGFWKTNLQIDNRIWWIQSYLITEYLTMDNHIQETYQYPYKFSCINLLKSVGALFVRAHMFVHASFTYVSAISFIVWYLQIVI